MIFTKGGEMRKISIFLFTLFIFSLTIVDISAARAPNIAAKSDILINAQSGIIINESNSKEIYGIASISKLMSAYIVYDAINAEKIN